MNKKVMLLVYMVIIFLMLIFSVTSRTMAAELPKVTWKFQLCCPPMSPKFVERVGLKRTPDGKKIGGMLGISQELSRAVSARTNGRFRLKIFAAGELFGIHQAYEGLERGSIDMWYGPPWPFAGRNSFANFKNSLPYAFQSPAQTLDFWENTRVLEITRRAYAKNNIYYISGGLACNLGMVTSFPIYKKADLKGKKLKGSGISGEILIAVGATPVKLGPAEVYTALQRGLIDGAIVPYFAFGEWGYLDIAKYVSLPPIVGHQIIDWVCNMDAWNRLPKEYQYILQEENDALAKWVILKMMPHLEKSEQKKWSKKGVQYITLSGEELREMKDAVEVVWDKIAAEGPDNAEGVKILREYLGRK